MNQSSKAGKPAQSRAAKAAKPAKLANLLLAYTVHPRRSLDDDKPDQYQESLRDWAMNNAMAVEWFLENHAAIRDALSSHAGLVGALKGMLIAFAGRYLHATEGGGYDPNQEKPWCSGDNAARQAAIVEARAALSAAQGGSVVESPRQPIQIGNTFLMPKPNESDNWLNAGWVGRVVGFRDGGKLVTVKDMDDKASDIEYDRLTACERA